jgi:hypothetical protein
VDGDDVLGDMRDGPARHRLCPLFHLGSAVPKPFEQRFCGHTTPQ